MKNDAIDCAIAEFLGWTEFLPEDTGRRRYATRPNSEGFRYRVMMVPQYHKCLNACHEMEKSLDDDQWDAYQLALYNGMNRVKRSDPNRDKDPIHASAEMRTAAFVRVTAAKLSTHIAV